MFNFFSVLLMENIAIYTSSEKLFFMSVCVCEWVEGCVSGCGCMNVYEHVCWYEKDSVQSWSITSTGTKHGISQLFSFSTPVKECTRPWVFSVLFNGWLWNAKMQHSLSTISIWMALLYDIELLFHAILEGLRVGSLVVLVLRQRKVPLLLLNRKSTFISLAILLIDLKCCLP